jgi:hypothetical protein
MRRSLVSFACAATTALAVAGPALAWDSVGITINPLSGAGSTIAGDPTDGSISGHSGDVIDMLLVSTSVAAPPAGDLGPRYVITYSFDGQSSSIAQDLYPYAPGGPVAYSATDGSIVGHPIQAGWHEGNSALLQVFVAWGLPATPNGATAPALGYVDRGAAQAARDAGTAADAALANEGTRNVALAVLAAGFVAVVLIGRGRQRLAPMQSPA